MLFSKKSCEYTKKSVCDDHSDRKHRVYDAGNQWLGNVFHEDSDLLPENLGAGAEVEIGGISHPLAGVDFGIGISNLLLGARIERDSYECARRDAELACAESEAHGHLEAECIDLVLCL